MHNPVTKTDFVMNFRTHSPRTITVCLDLHEGTVKFWLNGTRMQNRTLKLSPGGGPWVPCVRISQEGNCVSLNPFAKEPANFYEFHRDRNMQVDSLLMPILQNSICVANLPQIQASTVEESVNVLTQLFAHSSANISQIHMPELGSDNMFCLIKFHHYTYMVEFLHKHKNAKSPNAFEIFEAHQILSWFKRKPDEPLDPKISEYFSLVKKGLLKVIEGSPRDVAGQLKEAKQQLERLDLKEDEAESKDTWFKSSRVERSQIQVTQ